MRKPVMVRPLPPGCHRPEQRSLAYVRWQLYVPWHDEYIAATRRFHISGSPHPPRCPGCLCYFYIVIGAGTRRNQWPGLAGMRGLTDGDLGQNGESGFWWEEGVSGVAGRSRQSEFTEWCACYVSSALVSASEGNFESERGCCD